MSGPAVAIVNWNGGDDLLGCLAALCAQTRPAAEMVLVDNGSTDGSAEAAQARFPVSRRIDLPHNPGYGAGANAAARATTGDPVVVLNPDVVLDPDWLEVVADAFAADPRVGVVGSKLLFPDGTVQHAGGLLHRPLMLADHRRYRQPDTADELEPIDVEYVNGAAIAIRRAAFEEIGGFDEGFFLYFEETDLCFRAAASGWRVRYLPRARAIHRESAVTVRGSAGYYRGYHRGRIRFALKHLPPAAFLGELVPAERARLAMVVSLEELAGLRHAFVDHATLLAPGGDRLLAPTAPELRPALADALAQLAERAVATAPAGRRADPAPGPLRSLARVEPRPFRSDVPGVGGAIAAARTAWNWVSTRWYLAPILEQQNRLNAELVEALERLDARLARLEQGEEVQASWLVEIDRDLLALARRVAELDQGALTPTPRPKDVDPTPRHPQAGTRWGPDPGRRPGSRSQREREP
ncbi:MAG TPA: glycosyltransferase family 2 protein [Chloroflexota bacterium]